MAKTYAEVFERKEMKYRVNAEQRRALEQALSHYLAVDEYGATRIESLYYDNAQHDLICRSLEKPLYKEKLRLRSYGGARLGERVFIEMKKKYKGIVYKRRVGVSYQAARAYMHGVPYQVAVERYPLARQKQQAQALEPRSLQIAREIDAFKQRSGHLYPSMLISCYREAWCPLPEYAAELGDLRITFDGRIAYADLSGCTKMPSGWGRNHEVGLLAPGESILEIKSSAGLPMWLARTLSDLGLYKTSFSKYGEAYKAVVGLSDLKELKEMKEDSWIS